MKEIISTVFFIAIYTGSFAQPGISAGMNIAGYSYAESQFNVHRKSLQAYNFGILYKHRLTERLGLLPELTYSVKGARIYYDYPIGFTGPMKNVNRFRYLQLTLPAVFAAPVSDEIDYEIGAGLFIARLIKATQKTVAFDDSYTVLDFASSQLKKTDIGLHFTTGFRMAAKLGLHFCYDLGLRNIEPDASAPAVRTRNFSINLSWLLARK